MVIVCDDLSEIKIIIRCTLVACIEPLTINELWEKVIYILGGPQCVQLKMFGYDTVFDFLQSLPDTCQLADPECDNSIVNLVSSELSRHMELLVLTNIVKPPSVQNKISNRDLLIPYRIQCAFIRIFIELYPEGLSIADFVSDILCIPIFKSFIDCAEVLILNLGHIFKRDGLEMLILQPTLTNSLKEVIEVDKFSAMDIYNIDEYSLLNNKDDQRIAQGLEYKLFHILEEPIKKNIEKLLNEEESWISEMNICNLYIKKFGSSFSHYRRWGFCRVSQMFSKLPELCCVHFSNNVIEIISVKNHSCNIHKEITQTEEINLYSELVSLHSKKKTKEEPEENDGILKKFLRNDPLLEASLNDCFLDQEIPQFDLQINQSLDVNVCRVNMNIIPTIICQHIDKSQEFINLLIDMKKFYFMNESKFIFDSTVTMVGQTYAFFLNSAWFRGIVTHANLNMIKILNIDDGSIHDIPYEDIRLLHIQFSHLPAQAFTCCLHGIESIDENELSQILNKKCTIYVVAINQHTNCVSIKIKFMNSTSNNYLNEEWIKNGVAEPESSDEDYC